METNAAITLLVSATCARHALACIGNVRPPQLPIRSLISYLLFLPVRVCKMFAEIEGEMDRKMEWKTRRIDAKWTRRMIVRSSWHER